MIAVVVATVVVARWLWIGWGATGTPVLNVKVRAAVCVGAYTRVIDRVERSLARSSPLPLAAYLPAPGTDVAETATAFSR